MAVRLGIAPIGWTNSDLPELGGDIALETCLAEMREAGFTGTETGVKYPMDPAELGRVLERHGLRLVSGWFSGELVQRSVDEEKRRMREQLACFTALGAPVIVYAETTGSVQADRSKPVADRPVLERKHLPDYGRKLSELAAWLRSEGCPMTFHHHMGTVIETEPEIDLLMQHTTDDVGLLLDTGHLVFAAGDPIATTRRHAGRINHVHCKNIRPAIHTRVLTEAMSFLDAVVEGVFTVPGDPDGGIDFRAFAKVLAEIGYSGWVVVEAEQDPLKAHPLTYARMGHDELVAAFEAAGVAIEP
jgi:inosose dehydratase